MEGKIPTTIVTGFLGSGKTTIISHLIDYLLSRKVKVAYIKNEIGSEDVDGKLMRGKNIDTKELLNGCICCTLTGPFYFAIAELVETVKPDRIIIEASGVASPAAIALLVSSHDKIYRDGLISVIDVLNFEGYKDLSLTAREQAKLTDLIVFNKIEMADSARLQRVVGYVREYNDYAPVVEAPAGWLSPALAFGLDTGDVDSILEKNKPENGTHLNEDQIDTFSCRIDKAVNKEQLKIFLDGLPANIIRVKGLIKDGFGRTLLINKVGIRTDIREVPQASDVRSTKLVFIGFDIGKDEIAVKNDLIKNLNSHNPL